MEFNKGVSSNIGVLLLLSLTVILFSLTGYFVLGLIGDQKPNTETTVNFQQSESGNITITTSEFEDPVTVQVNGKHYDTIDSKIDSTLVTGVGKKDTIQILYNNETVLQTYSSDKTLQKLEVSYDENTKLPNGWTDDGVTINITNLQTNTINTNLTLTLSSGARWSHTVSYNPHITKKSDSKIVHHLKEKPVPFEYSYWIRTVNVNERYIDIKATTSKAEDSTQADMADIETVTWDKTHDKLKPTSSAEWSLDLGDFSKYNAEDDLKYKWSTTNHITMQGNSPQTTLIADDRELGSDPERVTVTVTDTETGETKTLTDDVIISSGILKNVIIHPYVTVYESYSDLISAFDEDRKIFFTSNRDHGQTDIHWKTSYCGGGTYTRASIWIWKNGYPNYYDGDRIGGMSEERYCSTLGLITKSGTSSVNLGKNDVIWLSVYHLGHSNSLMGSNANVDANVHFKIDDNMDQLTVYNQNNNFEVEYNDIYTGSSRWPESESIIITDYPGKSFPLNTFYHGDLNKRISYGGQHIPRASVKLENGGPYGVNFNIITYQGEYLANDWQDHKLIVGDQSYKPDNSVDSTPESQLYYWYNIVDRQNNQVILQVWVDSHSNDVVYTLRRENKSGEAYNSIDFLKGKVVNYNSNKIVIDCDKIIGC